MRSKYIWGGVLVAAGVLLICGWFLGWTADLIFKLWPALLILVGLSGAADKKRFGVWEIVLMVVGVLLLLRNLFNISLSSLIWGPVLGVIAIFAGVQILFGDRGKKNSKISVDGKEVK